MTNVDEYLIGSKVPIELSLAGISTYWERPVNRFYRALGNEAVEMTPKQGVIPLVDDVSISRVVGADDKKIFEDAWHLYSSLLRL